MDLTLNLALLLNSLGLSLTLTLSHVLLRRGGLTGGAFLSFPRLYYTGAALVLYMLIFLYYGYLLQRFRLSVFYPVYTTLSILFVFISGVLFFSEGLTVKAVVGIVFMLVGVVLLSTGSAA